MKLFEVTLNEKGLHFRRENPNPLTANQKCGIILARLGVVLTLGFFWLMTGH